MHYSDSSLGLEDAPNAPEMKEFLQKTNEEEQHWTNVVRYYSWDTSGVFEAANTSPYLYYYEY